MAITYTMGYSWASGGSTLSHSMSFSEDGSLSRDVEIPIAGTDREVVCVIDTSELMVFYMEADGDLTVETNDGTTPQETFLLEADKPLVWTEDCYFPVLDLFLGDVTSIFCTNLGAEIVNFKVRALFNALVP